MSPGLGRAVVALVAAALGVLGSVAAVPAAAGVDHTTTVSAPAATQAASGSSTTTPIRIPRVTN